MAKKKAKKKTTKKKAAKKAPVAKKRATTKKELAATKLPARRLIAPADIQSRIEQIDGDLLGLLQERAKLVVRLALKGAGDDPSTVAAGGVEQAIADLAGRAHGPLARRSIQSIFREVHSGCRSLVRETRIAFLGPQYSYCHLAALRRFGHGVTLVPVGTIAAVFEEVNRRHSDFGLVPIENSTDGRIADTLDMFTRLRVRICGEVEMEIHHSLLGKCSRNEVKEVYSKPQALSQCRNWLAKHLPTARTIEVTSTSTAAQLAREKPGAAAIASLEAGVHYGLDVLAERIEDNPGNATRFAVIGEHSAERSGSDRTALLFQTEHRFGALADALAIFKRNQLNLTWIESFPIPDMGRTYLFFVEMEGHETDAQLRKAVNTLKQKTLRMEILGSFPATEAVE